MRFALLLICVALGAANLVLAEYLVSETPATALFCYGAAAYALGVAAFHAYKFLTT